MQLNNLNKRPEVKADSKLEKQFEQLEQLLDELKTRELTNELVIEFNNDIEQINTLSYDEKKLCKLIKTTQCEFLKKIEKELKIVTKNHYRNMWMGIGIGAFGVPLGVAFGSSLGNMAFLGIGLPIGMVIGMAVGTSMDKKALEAGKQLDLEVKSH